MAVRGAAPRDSWPANWSSQQIWTQGGGLQGYDKRDEGVDSRAYAATSSSLVVARSAPATGSRLFLSVAEAFLCIGPGSLLFWAALKAARFWIEVQHHC